MARTPACKLTWKQQLRGVRGGGVEHVDVRARAAKLMKGGVCNNKPLTEQTYFFSSDLHSASL